MQQGLEQKDRKPMLLFNMLYNESLELAAQPIVNLDSGKVEAVEILSRFPDNQLLPDEMFRLARAYGILDQLTLLSCKKLTQTIHTLKPFVPKGVFFNVEADVSEATLQQVMKIFDFANETTVVLEVTEHQRAVFPWPNFVDREGFEVAMDDLGKGNSNLVELLSIKPHYIKICMEIVADLHKCSTKSIIIEAFKRIGDSLDSQVIAEGIETAEDLKQLREAGIKYGQGYYFSPPRNLKEVPVKEWEEGFKHKILYK
ncbi:EAL domain-containing protein [Effusibacillus lacus]|uniref:EAL domain-containing protein n=1 Tax=Effusibacillus lacus TaxID=1348429 RepID=A0A292YEA1_9BACL|nr:EAL domain-containing protein [Effusibacillus lacus]GAX91292.1 EAL domain-containing protein [Effusibacillus lacus]